MRFLWTLFFFLCASCVYAERGSSFPFISGDTFRSFADHVFDEEHPQLNPFDVKEGQIVFVKTDYLPIFFGYYHPYIAVPYILLTHNSDCPIPSDYRGYLEDPKLMAWFGQNLEGQPHPKLYPIPIGIANRCWPHGNVATVLEMDRLPFLMRRIPLYLNFQEATHSERSFVYRLFHDRPYCVTTPVKDFSAYLLDLKMSRFVLSPRGNGLDCHRTWEALLMGAIPIVRSSSLDPLYDGLPVLIVKEWEVINEQFLERAYVEMRGCSYAMDRLYADYWFKKIEAVRAAP